MSNIFPRNHLPVPCRLQAAEHPYQSAPQKVSLTLSFGSLRLCFIFASAQIFCASCMSRRGGKEMKVSRPKSFRDFGRARMGVVLQRAHYLR